MEYSPRDFLQAILPDEGIVVLARMPPAIPGGPKPQFSNLVYDTVDQAADALASADATKHNYYVGISTLREKGVMVGGKRYVRVKTNAHLTRCFVLDIDIDESGSKHGKPCYANKQEARDGIDHIARALSLPAPIIIDSGYGFHVFWPREQALPSADWRKRAAVFQKQVASVEPKAVADTARIKDSSGVLRIPETFNLKYETCAHVTLVQWYDGYVGADAFSSPLEGSGSNANPRLADRSIPLVNLTVATPKIELSEVANKCDWVRKYVVNHKQAGEREWYAMLGLVPYMSHTRADGTIRQGEDLAHTLSKGHPGYDPTETANKFAHAMRDQSGPTTCARFSDIDDSPCATCEFRGEPTPLQAARRVRRAKEETLELIAPVTNLEAKIADENGTVRPVVREEFIQLPKLPEKYYRGVDDAIYWDDVVPKRDPKGKIVRAEDGSVAMVKRTERVLEYPLYVRRRYSSESEETEQLEAIAILPKDGFRTFKVPLELLPDERAMARHLAGRGIVAEHGKFPLLVKYLNDFTRHLLTQEKATVEYSRFGWRDLHTDDPKFVVGNGVLNKKGELEPAGFVSKLAGIATAVAGTGDFDAWKRGFNMYNDVPNSEAYIFASLLGFAAPGMALAGYEGVLFNMVGPTGAGKSTAMKAMTSVWGRPNSKMMLPRDTVISRQNIIGGLCSIPVAFDEVTRMDPRALGDFALELTSGRGKERASKNGENRLNQTHWDTIVCSTSNTSIYDKLAQDRVGENAEMARVFEVMVGVADPQYQPLVNERERLLDNNYGLAGRRFIPYVMQSRKEIAVAIERTAQEIIDTHQLGTGGRLWATLVACVSVMGEIAKKEGLHDYDIDAVRDWAIAQVKSIKRAAVEDSHDPESILAEFINDNQTAIVRVDENGKVKLNSSTTDMRQVRARAFKEGDAYGTIMVGVTAFKEYCEPRNVDVNWLLRAMQARGLLLAKGHLHRLASGTNLVDTPTRCHVFKLNAVKLPEDATG